MYNKQYKEKVCEICGETFTPNSPSQKICNNPACLRLKRRQYTRDHAEKYRELNREYRKKKSVKENRREYDRQYQETHKEQIRAYKKMYYQKQRFLQHAEKGELIKNAYWFSLSADERATYLDSLTR